MIIELNSPGNTNMAAVPLFRDTNMAAVTACENTIGVVRSKSCAPAAGHFRCLSNLVSNVTHCGQ